MKNSQHTAPQTCPARTDCIENAPQKMGVTRRRIFVLLFGAAGGLFLGALSRIAALFLHRPAAPNSYGTSVEVGPITELPAPGAPPVLVPHGRFWLVHSEDGLVALHNGCTHLDCLVSWDRDRQQFLCPCHGSAFSHDGQVLRGPAPHALYRFTVTLTGPDGELLRAGTSPGAPIATADLLMAKDLDNASASETTPAQPVMVVVDTSRKVTLS